MNPGLSTLRVGCVTFGSVCHAGSQPPSSSDPTDGDHAGWTPHLEDPVPSGRVSLLEPEGPGLGLFRGDWSGTARSGILQ